MHQEASPGFPSAGSRVEPWFAFAMASVFVALAGWGAFHHELWRDEAQAWLIARDSASPLALLRNTRYEGHPLAWFLLIWPFARFAHSLVAMQVVHVGIGAATAFLVSRFAPAPRWVRAIAVLGYFPLYEYGVIARNYGLGLLALVAFCAAFARRREHPLWIGALLAFAANTSLPAAILAIGGAVALAVDILRAREPRRTARWAGIGVAATGVVLSALQMNPPPDSGYMSEWRLRVDLAAAGEALRTVVASYLPLARLGPDSWGSSYLELLPGYPAWSVVLALLLLSMIALGLARRLVAFSMFAAGAGGLLAFFYLKSEGYIRHQGFLFVGLGMALWLAETDRAEGKRCLAERVVRVIFPALLAVQLAGAATALIRERALIFSGGRDTADLVRAAGIDRMPMVAHQDWKALSVLAYLDKERVYYPAGSRWGSYVVWDRARWTEREVWGEALRCAIATSSSVVVLLDGANWESQPPPDALRSAVKPVGCRPGEMLSDESFCVAVLDRSAVPAWLERLAR